MFLLILITSALSTPITAEQEAVRSVAEMYAYTEDITILCEEVLAARQMNMQGWSPLCSMGISRVGQYLMQDTAWNVENREAFIAKRRKELQNPAAVRRTYLELKPIALGALAIASPKATLEHKWYITEILVPDFTKSISPELRTLYKAEALADETMLAARTNNGRTWNLSTVSVYETACLAFGKAALAAGFHDPLAVQWRLRREAEGGQALVDAYREIFTDFAASI